MTRRAPASAVRTFSSILKAMFNVSRSSVAALLGAVVLAASAAPLFAQAAGQPQQPGRKPMNMFDPTGVPDTSVFAPLNLPRGTEYRSGSGAPGPRYWQQKA